MKKSILKIFLYLVSISIIGLGVLLFLTTSTHTPAFTDSTGNLIPESIAEERMVTLGETKQYVLVRGVDKSAPLLIYVHGGPGMTSTPFLRTYNSKLEEHFLMVYWEQRGTSNSYNENMDKTDFNIEQITSDLGELTDKLLAEFGQKKVLLVGHSWGTIPALEYASASTETVAAYVAVAQTTNQIKSDTMGYEWALAEARRKEYKKSVSVLEKLGTPPYTYDEFVTQRKQVNFLGGGMLKPKSDLGLALIALQTPEFAWPKLSSLIDGVQFSGAALWEEQQQYNALKRQPSLKVPIFMLTGRYDRVISPELGETYFQALNAPLKEFIWFENSAHAPQFEEPELFNSTIISIAQKIGLLKS